jgi:hypothetical protein
MVKIVISLKAVYIFVLVLGILCLSVGVTAFRYDNLGTPSVFGHSTGEIAPPIGCAGILMFSEGVWFCSTNAPVACTGSLEFVQYDSATRTWSCGTY